MFNRMTPLLLTLAFCQSTVVAQSLSGLDPFNKNSEIRKAGRDAEKAVRAAGGKASDEWKAIVKKIESSASVESYNTYKNHIFDKNTSRRNTFIVKDSLHYKIIAPILGKRLEIEKFAFTFNAYVPNDMAAVTFESRIFVRGAYRPEDPGQALLLAHELTHSAQIKEMGGEKAFAKRYIGQIAEQVRKGKFTTAMHDDLGLEKEANAVEKRISDNTLLAVEFTNPTTATIGYKLRMDLDGEWKPFKLEPNTVRRHWAKVTEDSEIQIRFDHSFTSGVQEKKYHLDDEVLIGKTEPKPGEGKQYHFVKMKDGKGVDLKEGKPTTK